MNKVTVLYKHPQDEAAFEKYYSDIHIPLAAKIPDVDCVEFTKFSPGPGGQPAFYRMAELYFETEEIMMQSLGSEEGKAAAGDLPNFADGGFNFLIGKI